MFVCFPLSKVLIRDLIFNRDRVLHGLRHQATLAPFGPQSLAPESPMMELFKNRLDPIIRFELDDLLYHATFPVPGEDLDMPEEPEEPDETPSTVKSASKKDVIDLTSDDKPPTKGKGRSGQANVVQDAVSKVLADLPSPGEDVLQKTKKETAVKALYERFGQGVSDKVMEVMKDVGMDGGDLDQRKKVAALLGSWVAGVMTEKTMMPRLVSAAYFQISWKTLQADAMKF